MSQAKLVGLFLVLVVVPATNAQIVTGNPSADTGWVQIGSSLNNGDYIRGAGNFSYDTYRAAFVLGAGSNLLSSEGVYSWEAGDQVIALGGVMNLSDDGFAAGWGAAFSGDAVNSNLSTSVRLVSKFAVTGDALSVSTVRPGAGNGSGSLSNGDLGVGAILLGTDVGSVRDLAGGLLHTIDLAQQWNGTSAVTLDDRVGRYIFTKTPDVSNLLISWEVLLNVSLLGELHPGAADYPSSLDNYVATLQRSTNSTLFTDALIAVPEPATYAAILGIFALLYVSWRRHRKRGHL